MKLHHAPLRLLYTFLIVFLFSLPASAQDLLGYGHSTYAGIAGAAYNPASLADNPFSMDIMLCGAGVELSNNYVGIKRSELRNPNFGSSNLYLRSIKTKKAAFFRNEILLPGIMFSNDKFGWGVDIKVRSYLNIDGVQPELAHIAAFELNDPPNYFQDFENKDLGVSFMSWGEIGGTYAKVIRTGAEHFLAVGARPKFLLGLGAAYVYADDLAYNFSSDSTVTVVRGDLKFGHSDNFTFDGGLGVSWKMGFNPGVGIDAGIVYEFRPDDMQDHDKNKKFRKWPGYRERPVYKYRIAATLMDLGVIRFKHGEFSDHYTIDAQLWDLDDNTFDTTAPAAMYNTFELRQGGSKQGKGMWMRLPLALNVQYDYLIRENLYVNATAFTALYLRSYDGKRVHELTRLSITPRWEKRWYAVWAPVSFSRMGIVALGAGFRLGPLAIGTTDILAYAFRNKKVYGADLWFVLKVPLFPVGKAATKKGKTKSGGKVDECAD
ncbi:MAG: hypothetical protein RL007_240 [Bacteroidota bacterium]